MKRRSAFTIYHALVASLAIHASLAAPFVLPGWIKPPEEPEPLVMDLEGTVGTNQVEEKLVQETKGQEGKAREAKDKEKDKAQPTRERMAESQLPQREEQQQVESPPQAKEGDGSTPPEKHVEPVPKPQETPDDKKPPAPEPPREQPKAAVAGANDVVGAAERQEGQTIKVDPIAERELLHKYVTLLSKKVQANLVYPSEARNARLQGVTVVSFTVLPNGHIRPETLYYTNLTLTLQVCQ